VLFQILISLSLLSVPGSAHARMSDRKLDNMAARVPGIRRYLAVR
jgi:hypothetical protein